MTQKRNVGMRTSTEQARNNILLHLLRFEMTHHRNALRKSELGRIAFPNYNFKRPQGAAFSVAKVIRGMEDDALIAWYVDENNCGGHFLKPAGVTAATALLERSPSEGDTKAMEAV